MIRIERTSPTMVLYTDEEQGTGGYCELFKKEINKLQHVLGLTLAQCRAIYGRLLNYQILLYDNVTGKIFRERPKHQKNKPIVVTRSRDRDLMAEAAAADKRIEDIFEAQTGLKKQQAVVGVQQDF